MSEGKFRVVSDGTIRGTRVFAPNGDDVSDLILHFKYTVEQNAVSVPKLTLEIIHAEVDLYIPEVKMLEGGEVIQEIKAE